MDVSSVFPLYGERCKMDGEERISLGNPPPFILVDNSAAGDCLHDQEQSGPSHVPKVPSSRLTEERCDDDRDEFHSLVLSQRINLV